MVHITYHRWLLKASHHARAAVFADLLDWARTACFAKRMDKSRIGMYKQLALEFV